MFNEANQLGKLVKGDIWSRLHLKTKEVSLLVRNKVWSGVETKTQDKINGPIRAKICAEVTHNFRFRE